MLSLSIMRLQPSVASVEYLGGFIYWLKHLLESNTIHYEPKPADNLFATILVVLHLICPSQLDAFCASSIRVSAGDNCTPETKWLLALWEEIGHSGIWGSFMKATEKGDYQQLKGMADVFCHI
jgi:hypothetical protein